MAKEIKGWGTTLNAFFEGNNLILVPAGKSLDSTYPLIVSYQNVCNGEPVIIGSRIAVRTVVEYFRLYGDIEKILTALPHLNAKQVKNALGYYSNHKEEIDRYITENDEVYQEKLYKVWQKQ
ncbi:DUF433 domain-containing protein [candidate division KSB1 bacterium]|nr:DUF433 domain-containing protein [candidate division KSB1 bacterium]MBL7093033.1 DUF433 domain-containing protein [candidate division KSB1 bacterium]